MAPPQRYPSPAKQLVTLGRIARARDLSFEEFWSEAVRPGLPPVTTRRLGPNGERDDIPVGAVVWPSDTADRAVEQAATVAMKDAWQRSYEGQPPNKGEQAVMRLYGISTETDTGGIEAGSEVPLAASL